MTLLETPTRQYSQVKMRNRQFPVALSHLKLILVFGMFAGLALSPMLWLSQRYYPLTPLFGFLPTIPSPIDHILYGTLLLILAITAISSRPTRWIGIFVGLSIFEALFDQSRWQPWFYQYLILLTAVGIYAEEENCDDDQHHPALNACRFVVACTYFWSGCQKAHPDFVGRVFRDMTAPLTQLLPLWMAPAITLLGAMAPFVEIAIGIGLLTTRFRNYAVLLAIGMHAFILLALGPLGNNANSVVWPWNLTMVCLLLVLFWNRPGVSTREVLWPRRLRIHPILFLLVGCVPILSFFNCWDEYLSFSLYAGRRNAPTLYVTNAFADRLPKQILQYVFLTDKPGINEINLMKWSAGELNVPIYPEPRIYRNVARSLCPYAHQASDLRLVVKQTRILFSADKEISYDCPALAAGRIQ